MRKYIKERKQKNALGNWCCKYCTFIGRTRRELQKHHKEVHNSGKGFPPWNKGLTKENNDKIKNASEKISKILKGRPGHKLSIETRKKISDYRKQKIKENGGIWWSSRSKCKRSYAEEWTKKILENEVNDTSFYEEFHIGRWFLDFAWPNKKIGIEIDGAQHEWPERKKSDKEKDEYCMSLGWKILRLKWSDICNNTELGIQIIREFVLNSEIIDYNFIPKQKYIKKGYYHLPEEIWTERKEKILNSNVDLTKHGWKEKVIKCTGLTKRIIERTIEHFGKEFEGLLFSRNNLGSNPRSSTMHL